LVQAAAHVAGRQAIQEFLTVRGLAATPTTPAADLVMINQPLPNGWTFLGYYTAPAAEASPASAGVWHFWQAPTTADAPTLPAEKWEPVAPGIWAGLDQVRMLTTNGDFEGEVTDRGPAGFPDDLYGAAVATRQLRRVERGGATTTVGALVNDVENRDTSFVSQWRTIDPQKAYLVGADVYNVNGNPAVGWRWSGAIADEYAPLDRYAGPLSMQEGWQQFGGLAVPLPGAGSLQAWLLNTNSTGAAFFDNVTVLPISVPTPLWPNGRTRTELQREQWAMQFESYLRYPPIVDDVAWQAGMAEMGPLVRIDQVLSTGWTLQGYSADETALARGDETPIFLYWQGPVGSTPGEAEEGWLDLHNGRWLQVVAQARNAATNGTFENGIAPWDADIYGAPAETHQVTVTMRSGFTTTAGVLANTSVYSVTGAAGPQMPLTPGAVYLQSGWMQGEAGRGYIGMAWTGEIDPTLAPFDRYIAGAQAPLGWRQYAGVQEPLPGANTVEVRVINYLGEGPTHFDDIVLAAIPAPRAVVTDTEVFGTAGAPQGNRAEVARRYLAEYQDDPSMLLDEAWLANVATAGPALRIDQAIGDGWTFEGMSADEQALAGGAITTVFYFWRGPGDVAAGTAEDGWYSLDVGYWLQIEEGTASLIPNGNLELPAAEAAEAEFPLDYLSGEPATAKLAVAAREGVSTTVVLLANAVQTDTTGIASATLPLDPQRWVLHSAWLDSMDGGNGVLGVSWGTGESPGGEQETPLGYTAENVQGSGWRQHARLHTPPEGSQGVQAFAYNYLAPGSVAVDDMLLLPVRPPAAFAPAVGVRQPTPARPAGQVQS
jgi:hypothetical protein